MFESLKSIIQQCIDEKKDFARIVVDNEMKATGKTEEEIRAKMKRMWDAMLEASRNYDGNLISKSGLSGGDGKRFEEYTKAGKAISDSYNSKVITEALKMAESNACMKRIVASPTAGSCGVLPAVLIPLFLDGKFPEEKIIDALFVSAGIGQIIANKASLSGAQGGCQAEIGSASAMASGALVFLFGGNEEQISSAITFTLQNLMGLVCDPVSGLVEVPCVKRNVIGAMNAVSCADLALAGIKAKIPADEVIDAMKQVGNKMDSSLKETGMGGVAACQTAKQVHF